MIPKSERTQTKSQFFDSAITLWSHVTDLLEKYYNDDYQYIVVTDEYGHQDMMPNPNFWRIKLFREQVETYMSNMISNLTHADTIYISGKPETVQYEYNIRRRYMTDAIGDLRTVEQLFQHEIKRNAKQAKILRACVHEFKDQITSIKNWRQSDNKLLSKLLNKN